MASIQINKAALRKRVEYWEKENPDFSKWLLEDENNGLPIQDMDASFVENRKMKKAAIEEAVDKLVLSDFVMQEIKDKTLREEVAHWGAELPALLPLLKKLKPLFVVVSEFAGLKKMDRLAPSKFVAGIALAPFALAEKEEKRKADMLKECAEWMRPVFKRMRARYSKNGELNKAVEASNELIIEKKVKGNEVEYFPTPNNGTRYLLITSDDIIEFVNAQSRLPLLRTSEDVWRQIGLYVKCRQEVFLENRNLPTKERGREARRIVDEKKLGKTPPPEDCNVPYKFDAEKVRAIYDFCTADKKINIATTISEETTINDFFAAVSYANFKALYEQADTKKTKLQYIIHLLAFYVEKKEDWRKAAAGSIGMAPTRLTSSHPPEDWKKNAKSRFEPKKTHFP
jgi:hypothetical protein